MRRITIEALGLSPKEHVVLNVLQQQTLAQKVSRISLSADLPHTTTSFILRKLEKRKLVEHIQFNNHFRWKYRKNLDIFENSNTQEFKSTFLNVVSGMRNITKELMKILELSSTDRLYAIQGAGISKTILNKIDLKFLYFFHQEVKRQKIIIEGVLAESVFNLFSKMNQEQLESHKNRMTIVYVLPDDLINFPLDIFLFKDKTFLVDYEAERLIQIKDSASTQSFKSLFNLAENYGRKINLNTHLQGLIERKKDKK